MATGDVWTRRTARTRSTTPAEVDGQTKTIFFRLFGNRCPQDH